MSDPIVDIESEEVRSWIESQIGENKASLTEKKSGLSSLCGMLNSDAATGKVVFGVRDDGAICGIESSNLDSIQRSLAEHISARFDPQPHVTYRLFKVGGKAIVLVLEAVRPKSIPYYEYGGRAFIREGTTTRMLSVDDRRSLDIRRRRDTHGGPWKCDGCGSMVGMLVSNVITDKGIVKTYNCTSCSGEYWPA